MKKTTAIKKAECIRVELSGEDILKLLKDNFVVPVEATLRSVNLCISPEVVRRFVNFKVPSGGDYSGQEVKISSEDPIYVEAEILTEE